MTTQSTSTPETGATESADAPVLDAGHRRCCGGVDRRTVLRTAGIAGAGAMTLAACGAAEDAANDAVASATDAASGAIQDAIDQATIPVGGGKIFADAKVVVTQPTEGEFKAFSSICTHQGCPVTKVEDNVISCTCHGSQFDAATGAVKEGPATKPLPEKTVTVGADGITVS